MRGLFITATNTDVGKTVVTGTIAAALKARGFSVGVFKPLASGGAVNAEGKLIAADASFLMRAAEIDERFREEVNAVCLGPALAPAVAAAESGVTIDMEAVIADLLRHAQKYELVLVEGVGGIAAPLWEDFLVADLMARLGLPAVLVSAPLLGSISHVVLACAYAKQRRLRLGGVLFNRWDADGVLETSNQRYIERLTGLPALGKLPTLKIVETDAWRAADLAAAGETYAAIDEILRIVNQEASEICGR